MDKRLNPNINVKKRQELIFGEVQSLEDEVIKRSKKTSCRSDFFRILNYFLNLSIILCSAIIFVLEGISGFESLGITILSGIIFAISGANELLKLGQKGYHYRQGTIRLKRIAGQIKNILYLFHTYTIEEILVSISSFRIEIDEIDMDLYKSSMPGDVKYGDLTIKDPEMPNTRISDSEPRIHIHIDSSEERDSPKASPKISPKSSPKLSPQISRKNSPMYLKNLQ
jgi:hypothetical protein